MFQIRQATAADMPAVDALLAQSYPRLLAPDYEAEVLEKALPLISRAQPSLVICGSYYLVEQDERFLGAGGWTAEAPGTGGVTAGQAHIRHVATAPEAVRCGVGRALMAHIFGQCRAAGIQQLMCYATLTAVPFYAATGFEPQGAIDIALPGGVLFPAVKMTRTLTAPSC